MIGLTETKTEAEKEECEGIVPQRKGLVFTQWRWMTVQIGTQVGPIMPMEGPVLISSEHVSEEQNCFDGTWTGLSQKPYKMKRC